MEQFNREVIDFKKISERGKFKVSLVKIQKDRSKICVEAVGNPPQGDNIEMQSSFLKDELWKHTVWVREDMHKDFFRAYLDMVKKASWELPNHELITQLVNSEDFGKQDVDIVETLKQLNEDEKIKTIFSSLSKIELKNLHASYKQKQYKIEIENLKQLLDLEENKKIVEEIEKYENLSLYTAKQPEKIFQKWIEKNLWVFGVEYIKKHDARKIAISSEADLLMESMDGFLDLIELKRPKLKHKIFLYDNSHKSYYPSADLSEAIGQCLLYLQEMDKMKLILENDYNVKIIRPRVKIIIGRTKDFNDDELKALRMLNSNLNHIQVISYDYLLSCGNKIISLYDKKN